MKAGLVGGSRRGWGRGAGQVNKTGTGVETDGGRRGPGVESAGIKAAEGKGSQWRSAVRSLRPSIHHYKSLLPSSPSLRKSQSQISPRQRLPPTPLRAAPLHSLSGCCDPSVLRSWVIAASPEGKRRLSRLWTLKGRLLVPGTGSLSLSVLHSRAFMFLWICPR